MSEGRVRTARDAEAGKRQVVVPQSSARSLTALASGNMLTVPPAAVLAEAVAAATTVEELIDLDKMFVVMQAAAKQLDLALSEAIRLAVAHLRARRKLGLVLMQTVWRGGNRSKCHRDTLLEGALPAGIDGNQSRRLRKLATIPEAAFETYLSEASANGRIPSEAGAARSQSSVPAVKSPDRRRAAKAPALSPELLDAVERCLGNIDVVVGEPDVRALRRVEATTRVPDGLRGAVFVAECRDPEEWLPAVAALRTKAAVDDVVVVLPADPSAKWFRHMADGWCCCFVHGEHPVLLAHRGLHAHSFELVMGEHGVVLRAAAT